MVFFYFLTTGWIFYVSLFENPINQPTSHTVHENSFVVVPLFVYVSYQHQALVINIVYIHFLHLQG